MAALSVELMFYRKRWRGVGVFAKEGGGGRGGGGGGGGGERWWCVLVLCGGAVFLCGTEAEHGYCCLYMLFCDCFVILLAKLLNCPCQELFYLY